MRGIPNGIVANLVNARTTPRLPVQLPTPQIQPAFREYTFRGRDVAQPTITLFPIDRGKAGIEDFD